MSVFIFTRLFFGLTLWRLFAGVGFASVISTSGGGLQLIPEAARPKRTHDVRGLVISGYFICCFAAPAAYGLGRLAGLDALAPPPRPCWRSRSAG